MTTAAGGGRAERVQTALFRIAELASSVQDMQEFYREVHAVVGAFMYANNFFIALYDEERQLISWPYYVDELDPDVPEPNQWDAFGEGDARGRRRTFSEPGSHSSSRTTAHSSWSRETSSRSREWQPRRQAGSAFP